MSITRHLDDATVMSLAAGTLAPALAVVAASHVAVCPLCREGLVAAETVGAALLDTLAPVPISGELPSVPLTDPANEHARVRTTALPNELPLPLARLVGRPLDAVRWRPLGIGIWHHRIVLHGGADSGELHLIRVSCGRGLPAHGHNGTELTLVLRGAYSDETGQFRVGDTADLDESIEHQPIADPDLGCICVLACERPARFKGLLPRLLQPLTGL
jgi:putative transcriptional regulator